MYALNLKPSATSKLIKERKLICIICKDKTNGFLLLPSTGDAGADEAASN